MGSRDFTPDRTFVLGFDTRASPPDTSAALGKSIGSDWETLGCEKEEIPS